MLDRLAIAVAFVAGVGATFSAANMMAPVSRETKTISQAYLCGYAAGIRHAEGIPSDHIDEACRK